jgi:hypothetical protein
VQGWISSCTSGAFEKVRHEGNGAHKETNMVKMYRLLEECEVGTISGKTMPLQELLRETDFADEEVDQIAELKVGEGMKFEGGAVPMFGVERVS